MKAKVTENVPWCSLIRCFTASAKSFLSVILRRMGLMIMRSMTEDLALPEQIISEDVASDMRSTRRSRLVVILPTSDATSPTLMRWPWSLGDSNHPPLISAAHDLAVWLLPLAEMHSCSCAVSRFHSVKKTMHILQSRGDKRLLRGCQAKESWKLISGWLPRNIGDTRGKLWLSLPTTYDPC